MKGLVIILFLWSFIGVFMYDLYGSIEFVLSINMLLTSLLVVKYFKSLWWSLTLVLSIPNFLNEIIPILNLTPHVNALSTFTTISIITISYLPSIKWKY